MPGRRSRQAAMGFFNGLAITPLLTIILKGFAIQIIPAFFKTLGIIAKFLK
jgi:hypothetical protein